jgi:hypothetical protein
MHGDVQADRLAKPRRPLGAEGFGPLQHVEGGVERLARGHDLVDQAPRRRVRRGHRTAREQEFQRDLVRQLLHDPERPAGAGHQAALHLRQADVRGLDGDREVAREQQLGAAAEGVAVHRGDRRLRGEVVDEPREAQLLPARRQDQLTPGDRLEVRAGAERLVPRPGEHERPDLGIGLRLLDRIGHPVAHVHVDAVPHLGAVQRHDEDVTALFDEDLVAHAHPACFRIRP